MFGAYGLWGIGSREERSIMGSLTYDVENALVEVRASKWERNLSQGPSLDHESEQYPLVI